MRAAAFVGHAPLHGLTWVVAPGELALRSACLASAPVPGIMPGVPKPKLRFLTRKGRDLTLADDTGHEHRATLSRVEASASVRENGSFVFGYCKSCDWVGPARRARAKAGRDALGHEPNCEGRGKVRIGVTGD